MQLKIHKDWTVLLNIRFVMVSCYLKHNKELLVTHCHGCIFDVVLKKVRLKVYCYKLKYINCTDDIICIYV